MSQSDPHYKCLNTNFSTTDVKGSMRYACLIKMKSLLSCMDKNTTNDTDMTCREQFYKLQNDGCLKILKGM